MTQTGPDARARRITRTLTARFTPVRLEVVDDSARHAGHRGATPGGETHYSVTIVAAAFRGMGRVARARTVHEALASEFDSGLHALALTLRDPDDVDRRS